MKTFTEAQIMAAYRKGAQAYVNGAYLSANPYGPVISDALHKSWIDGFCDERDLKNNA